MGRHQRVWIPEERTNTGGIMGATAVGLALIALVVGGIYMGYGEKVTALFPAAQAADADSRALKSADAAIASVTVVGSILEVEARLAATADDPGYVDAAGDLVRKIGQKLQSGVDDDSGALQQVRVRLVGTGSDRLGADIQTNVMALTFLYADMKAANFERLPAEKALDLASRVRAGTRVGTRAIGAWCAADDHAAEARNFCSLARS
jgi:hypothetical protein